MHQPKDQPLVIQSQCHKKEEAHWVLLPRDQVCLEKVGHLKPSFMSFTHAHTYQEGDQHYS